MNLFYTLDVGGEYFRLQGQEARHCAQVLRKNIGDEVIATNGKGLRLSGTIDQISKDEVMVKLTQKEVIKPEQRSVHLAIAPTKNNARMEWLIEKVTEIGVASIQPIICQRSERPHIKMERLQKILVSASKQSLRIHFPQLREAMKYETYINQLDVSGYIAHYLPEHKNLWEHNYSDEPSVILIGPEGDFTRDEVEAAQAKGLLGVNLGSSRLRTETAGIVAVTHLLQGK